jgi:hypothetical protein
LVAHVERDVVMIEDVVLRGDEKSDVSGEKKVLPLGMGAADTIYIHTQLTPSSRTLLLDAVTTDQPMESQGMHCKVGQQTHQQLKGLCRSPQPTRARGISPWGSL